MDISKHRQTLVSFLHICDILLGLGVNPNPNPKHES